MDPSLGWAVERLVASAQRHIADLELDKQREWQDDVQQQQASLDSIKHKLLNLANHILNSPAANTAAATATLLKIQRVCPGALEHLAPATRPCSTPRSLTPRCGTPRCGTPRSARGSRTWFTDLTSSHAGPGGSSMARLSSSSADGSRGGVYTPRSARGSSSLRATTTGGGAAGPRPAPVPPPLPPSMAMGGTPPPVVSSGGASAASSSRPGTAPPPPPPPLPGSSSVGNCSSSAAAAQPTGPQQQQQAPKGLLAAAGSGPPVVPPLRLSALRTGPAPPPPAPPPPPPLQQLAARGTGAGSGGSLQGPQQALAPAVAAVAAASGGRPGGPAPPPPPPPLPSPGSLLGAAGKAAAAASSSNSISSLAGASTAPSTPLAAPGARPGGGKAAVGGAPPPPPPLPPKGWSALSAAGTASPCNSSRQGSEAAVCPATEGLPAGSSTTWASPVSSHALGQHQGHHSRGGSIVEEASEPCTPVASQTALSSPFWTPRSDHEYGVYAPSSCTGTPYFTPPLVPAGSSSPDPARQYRKIFVNGLPEKDLEPCTIWSDGGSVTNSLVAGQVCAVLDALFSADKPSSSPSRPGSGGAHRRTGSKAGGDPNASSSKGTAQAGQQQQRAGEIKVLSKQREFNLGIILKRFGVAPRVLARQLNELDGGALDGEAIRTVRRILPSDEDLKLIADAKSKAWKQYAVDLAAARSKQAARDATAAEAAAAAAVAETRVEAAAAAATGVEAAAAAADAEAVALAEATPPPPPAAAGAAAQAGPPAAADSVGTTQAAQDSRSALSADADSAAGTAPNGSSSPTGASAAAGQASTEPPIVADPPTSSDSTKVEEPIVWPVQPVLGPVEEMLEALGGVECLEEKLLALEFRRKLVDLAEDLQQYCVRVTAALEVVTGPQVTWLVRLVRDIVNYINRHSTDVPIAALRLADLSKLKATKAINSEVTVMNLLAAYVTSVCPAILELSGEQAALAAARKDESLNQVHEALEAITATQQKLLRHQERIQAGSWEPTRNEVAAASLKAVSRSSAAGSKKSSVLARAAQMAGKLGPGVRQGSGGPGGLATPREDGSSSMAGTPRARNSNTGTPRAATPRGAGSSRFQPSAGNSGEVTQQQPGDPQGSSRPRNKEVEAQRQLYMANLRELLQGTAGSVDALHQQLAALEEKLLSVLGFYCELGSSSSSSGNSNSSSSGAVGGKGSARGAPSTSRSFSGGLSARKAPAPVDMNKLRELHPPALLKPFSALLDDLLAAAAEGPRMQKVQKVLDQYLLPGGGAPGALPGSLTGSPRTSVEGGVHGGGSSSSSATPTQQLHQQQLAAVQKRQDATTGGGGPQAAGQQQQGAGAGAGAPDQDLELPTEEELDPLIEELQRKESNCMKPFDLLNELLGQLGGQADACPGCSSTAAAAAAAAAEAAAAGQGPPSGRGDSSSRSLGARGSRAVTPRLCDGPAAERWAAAQAALGAVLVQCGVYPPNLPSSSHVGLLPHVPNASSFMTALQRGLLAAGSRAGGDDTPRTDADVDELGDEDLWWSGLLSGDPSFDWGEDSFMWADGGQQTGGSEDAYPHDVSDVSGRGPSSSSWGQQGVPSPVLPPLKLDRLLRDCEP